MRGIAKNTRSGMWALAIGMILMAATSAYALPDGESVVEGAATFDRSVPNVLTINTSSDKLIINYNSFSIAAGESVYFYQPSVSSSALNRVQGSGVSNIYGMLSANGIIYLINPNGINISPGASINAVSFIASTLNMANADFLNNRLSFYKDGANGFILNRGQIIVRDGGYVALLAGAVENQGSIRANLGSVALAGGEKMTLALDDLGEISVVVDEAVKSQVLDFNGAKVESAVNNSGQISVSAGKVILTAKVLNNVFKYAVNNSGIVEANSLVNRNGVIELVAEGAPAINTGRLEAGEVKVAIKDADFINKGEIIAKQASEADIYGNIYISALNIYQGGLILADKLAELEAADKVSIILRDNPVTLAVDPFAQASAGVMIQASQVKIAARQFGLNEAPLSINAGFIYMYRNAGSIDILESVGLGSSVMLRGPPSGFGAILYNKGAELSLDAQKVAFAGSNPVYLYGNIVFNNLNIIVPDKEVYFEAGKSYVFKGSLSIVGAADIGPEEFFIKLRSSSEGSYYYLDLSAADYNLERVNLKDAYALYKVIIPIGVDAGNNVNFEIDPTWDGGGTTNNWSDAVNWSGNTLPTSTTDASFDATSTKDSVVDALFAGSIRDLLIGAGYTGTITFERSLSARDFSQAGGTVSLGSQTFTLSRNFSLSGGMFNANTGSLGVANNFTVSGAGVFSEGTSSVTFNGAGATINVLTSETFFNLTFAPSTAGANKTVSANDTLIVTGTLTLTEGNINQGATPAAGTISAQGNIVQNSTFDGGSGVLVIAGTANQLFTGNATASAGELPDLTINKSGGTLTLTGTIRINGAGAGAWTYVAGTVDATTNNSLVLFNGANTIDGQGTSSTMAFDNVEFTGGTSTLAGSFDVDGDLTISAGTLNTSASDFSVNVAGNWSNSATFTSNDSVVTLDGSSSSMLDTGGVAAGDDFETLVIAKSAGAVVTLVNNNLDINGTLTISSGTLYLNGRNITTTTSFVNNGTLRLQGIETVSWTVNDTDSGSWEYVGRNVAETITIKDFGASDYFNLVINDTNANKAAFSAGSALDINGSLTLSSGSFNAPSGNLNISGNWINNGATFNAGTGTVIFDGTTAVSGSSATTFNNISITGTLTGHATNINVSGNWANSGTFIHNSGTVTFTGSGVSVISGSTTFFNFSVTAAGKQLTFAAGTTQTITGTLTLTGASGNLVVLRSSVSGSQWNINPQGTRSVSFVDVKDSNNTNASAISAPNSKDSGNNTNWSLVDHFNITGSSSQIAGSSNSIAITAIDGSGGTALSYDGVKSLTFSGSGSIGSFSPAVAGVNFGSATNITFTNGVASGVSMVLYNATESQPRTITASAGSITTGTALSVTVSPVAANSLTISGITSPIGSGELSGAVITLKDSFGNTATGYTGRVHFTSSDSAAVLPADYTFTALDAGTHSFNAAVAFNTAGTQSITATDTLNSSITGSVSVTVNSLPANNTNNSADIAIQLATPLLSGEPFIATTSQFGTFQPAGFNPGGQVYLYHPLTPVETGLFDSIMADDGFLAFLESLRKRGF